MSAQFGEDAILARIFATIGTTNRFAVECGARDGVGNSNTHQLRVSGWTCVLLDAYPQAPIVAQVFLTAENIEATFAAHGVPATFDLLSIDIDGNDFWLWRALTAYVPRVVVIEYNSSFGPDERRVITYEPARRWDKTDYYGASAAALAALGEEKGYLLAAVTRANLIFVQAAAAEGLAPVALPPAAPYGYPHAKGRPWEVV